MNPPPSSGSDGELHVLRESVDLLILKALTWGPRHGYAIAEWIESATTETVLVQEGTLYPALHRLGRRGMVRSEWGVSDNNRRAKFYSLTPAGRARLRTTSSMWHRHVEAIARALRLTPDGSAP